MRPAWYNARRSGAIDTVPEELFVNVIQKGYGEVKLIGSGEVLQGEITLHAEGWIAVAPMPPEEDGEVRWFPNQQVAELVWRKSLAVRGRRE